MKKVNLKESWDWLIILDAMRYDYFKKCWESDPYYRKLDYTLEPRLSYGSCTLEYLGKMPTLHDAICVTGHPFVLQFKYKFKRVVDVGFDNKLNTVPPEYIINYVLKKRYILALYKRRVLWFLQPHYPFIHPNIDAPTLTIPIFEDVEKGAMPPQAKIEEMYREAKKKGILEKAYEGNVIWILRELKKLLPHLHGKIIVTSDHGDGLGKPLRPSDKPVYAHPCNREEWELLLVPWCVIYL